MPARHAGSNTRVDCDPRDLPRDLPSTDQSWTSCPGVGRRGPQSRWLQTVTRGYTLGQAWDGGDLNLAIANKCRDARRNVLRDLQGSWSMCVNLQWQLCAVRGKLPNQGSSQISFATAPKDLEVGWWEDPANNPILGKWTPFGCCDPNRCARLHGARLMPWDMAPVTACA